MTARPLRRLLLLALSVLLFPAAAGAQVSSAVYEPEVRDRTGQVVRAERISVSFLNEVSFPKDERGNPAPVRALVYFEDPGDDVVVQYRADAVHAAGDENIGNVVNLTNFKAVAGGGGAVNLASLITDGKKRDLIVVIRNVILSGETRPKRVQTSAAVRPQNPKPPILFMFPVDDQHRDALRLQVSGVATRDVVARLGNSPEKVSITYDFAAADTVSDTTVRAASLRSDPENASTLLVEPPESLFRRAESYTVTVQLPVAELRGAEDKQAGFEFPADATTLDASRPVKLIPNVPARAASEFYFEATYNSTVNQKNRNRSHVGVFGLNIRPTIEPLTYNVRGRGQGKPFWLALRPFFEADVDTQSPKDSKSPNRINLGADFEYGQNVGLAGGPRFLPYFIWLNGFHHESDRDFKLRTIYWHTEFVPYFFDWEKTREQTLHQFRTPCRPPTPGAPCERRPDPERAGRQPLVSAYRFRPSVGYDLGGTLNRDNRGIDAPTEDISRFLFKLDTSVELKRRVTFALENTYYFLENAPRRRSRDYLETRLELNTGHFFGNDLGGLQHAITFKFQRGDQSPTFKSVNAFSAGFKIFR